MSVHTSDSDRGLTPEAITIDCVAVGAAGRSGGPGAAGRGA